MSKLSKFLVWGTPFLLGLYWTLALYAENLAEVYWGDAVLTCVFVVFFVGIILIGTKLFVKDMFTASLIASVGVIFVFSYGFFAGLGLDKFIHFAAMHPIVRHSLRVGIYFAIPLFLTSVIIIRLQRHSLVIAKIASIFAFSLVVVVLISIVKQKVQMDISRGEKLVKIGSDAVSSLEGHDIYYIILDGYAGDSALQEFYGFSNSFFLDELRRRGFYVASNSKANYDYTMQSLPASLNMEYVHTGVDGAKSVADYLWLRANNKVATYLKSYGYEYVQVSVGNLATGWNPSAYANFIYKSSLFNDFFLALSKASIFAPLSPFFESLEKKSDINQGMQAIKKILSMEEKTFTFAHFMSPHPPYCCREGADYSPVELFMINAAKSRKSYIDELQFINSKILELVDDIISKSKVHPIIIIQGDHGARPIWRGKASVPVDEHSEEMRIYLREVAPILNAYFLPDSGQEMLYDTISPVNSFRIVLSYYFGEALGLLDDKTFIRRPGGFSEFNLNTK